jgi:hypothetical protein
MSPRVIGEWVVREPTPDDRNRWEELFTMYGEFYDRPITGEMAARVWSWISDGHLGVRCLLVGREGERSVGLAHFRIFARPLAASVGGFLDDLFVDESERSSGAVDALFLALGFIALEEKWSLLRGITAEDNYRARAKYDQFATRTGWITYECTPAQNPVGRTDHRYPTNRS